MNGSIRAWLFETAEPPVFCTSRLMVTSKDS